MATHHAIDTVIDLEGEIDTCIPCGTNQCLYIYFPINDEEDELPDMVKLRGIARLAATVIADGQRVLARTLRLCRAYNRSAFMAGLILVELGMSGADAVARLRERRPGALFNDGFARCLESLAPALR